MNYTVYTESLSCFWPRELPRWGSFPPLIAYLTYTWLLFPTGTLFGLLKDIGNNRDFLVVAGPVTGIVSDVARAQRRHRR